MSMLGSAVPATATIQTSTSSATPTSPTRPSRLRGLSYLRSYTHSHLHSRNEGPPLPRSASHPPGGDRARSPRQRAHTRDDSGRSTGSSGIQSGENGWLPTVQGRSGLSRDSLHPTSTSTESFARDEASRSADMARSRVASMLGAAPAPASVPGRSFSSADGLPSAVDASSNNMDALATSASGPSSSAHGREAQPTIRLIPHVEPRSARPSLHFTATSRTLKTPGNIVRVGRYSERDHTSLDPDCFPIGFKSKVVSRRHCEFWCTNGQWYIKDVKSSSGTFLNHVRLSPPGQESRPFPVNDGDVVQLGIDFKGGEEVIFRCVKIRVECNRGWQKSLNAYNTNAHRRLLKSAGIKSKNRDSDAASVNSSECSICLNPVAPCQALFVAPCSHVWHYKCVRNLIHGPSYPNFLCPNCRFVADLEADVEPPEEADDEFDFAELEGVGQPMGDDQPPTSSEDDDGGQSVGRGRSDELSRDAPTQPQRLPSITSSANITDEELAGLFNQTSLQHSRQPSPNTLSPNDAVDSSPSPGAVAIAQPQHQRNPSAELLGARSTTPTSNAQYALAAGVMSDGPITPRNDAGPFLLDGNGGDRDGIDRIATQAVREESEPESAGSNSS